MKPQAFRPTGVRRKGLKGLKGLKGRQGTARDGKGRQGTARDGKGRQGTARALDVGGAGWPWEKVAEMRGFIE